MNTASKLPRFVRLLIIVERHEHTPGLFCLIVDVEVITNIVEVVMSNELL